MPTSRSTWRPCALQMRSWKESLLKRIFLSGYKRPAVYVFIEVERMRVTLLKASGVPRSAAPSLRKIKFVKFNGRAKSSPIGVPCDRKKIEKERREIVYKRSAEITATTRRTSPKPGWFLKLTIFWWYCPYMKETRSSLSAIHPGTFHLAKTSFYTGVS